MDSIQPIDIHQYTKVGTIDNNIYKVVNQHTSIYYDAKLIHDYDNSNEALKTTKKIVGTLSKLNHPCINKFVGYSESDFEGKQNPVIFTEFTANGSVETFLSKERRGQPIESFNLTKKVIIIYGISSAMFYMHKQYVIHRDLKTSNILLTENFQPKLAVFDSIQITLDPIQKNFFGSPIYAAPEVWEGNYGKASDVYAFGMIMFQILTGLIPFREVKSPFEISKLVSNGERPEIPHGVPDVFIGLIKKCWEQNPKDRISFDEIVTTLDQIEGQIDNDLFNEDEFKKFRNLVDNNNNNFKSKNIDNNNNDDDKLKTQSKCCLLF